MPSARGGHVCRQGFVLDLCVGSLLARMVCRETTPEGEDTLRSYAPQRAFEGLEALR